MCTNLTELHLQSASIDSLWPLGKCKQLITLELFGFQQLVQLDSLTPLTGLTSLTLWSMIYTPGYSSELLQQMRRNLMVVIFSGQALVTAFAPGFQQACIRASHLTHVSQTSDLV